MREIGSFIVRIYRRDTTGISGVVEDVQTGCIHSFHSALDLWRVLEARPIDPPQSNRKPT
jgi:hypothetical protein